MLRFRDGGWLEPARSLLIVTIRSGPVASVVQAQLDAAHELGYQPRPEYPCLTPGGNCGLYGTDSDGDSSSLPALDLSTFGAGEVLPYRGDDGRTERLTVPAGHTGLRIKLE